MSQTTYQTGQGTVTVTLERRPDGAVTATVGDRSFELTAVETGDGSWLLEHNGRLIQYYTASDGPRRFVQRPGGPVYAVTVSGPAGRRRGSGGAAEGALTAQMPGQVVDVMVKAGDAVMAGQPLVILEAMKMEIRVAAPADGTVREVFVEKGTTVERDQQLLALE
jgi:biotin carboxyl carrier protein